MKGDRHTSKSKLNLRDGVGHKTGLQPRNPHIGKSCEQSAKHLTGKCNFTKIAVIKEHNTLPSMNKQIAPFTV